MIIESLLDTDLYKFTMMQVALHHFPAAQVEYRFTCRTPGVLLAPHIEAIRSEIAHLCTLRFSEDELDYLRSLRFIKSDFIDFLGLFHLNARSVSVQPAVDAMGRPTGGIDLRISGPWLHTILFEVPLLAIVEEVYYRGMNPAPDLGAGRQRLSDKISALQAPDLDGVRIADYGTRRRYSRVWQEEVLARLKAGLGVQLAGTSNVMFAMRLGLTPLGTMAHEYLQACQALGPRLRDSQTFALETWAHEYRGDLGIALSDAYGLQAFLRDFDLYFCKLFDGARHDSGDPIAWAEAVIEHYRKHRIDPRTKTLIFSDALTVDRVVQLYRLFQDSAQLAFGIGTNLTHDLGYPAAQMVIKMTRCNGQPVAKISDSPGKNQVFDPAYVTYLRQVFQIPPETMLPETEPEGG
ncbi:MAG: nicotinate phosphoribosyltransferase [Betaproteobacteria bacterium]|nr:nicotinate phosphoribosyltransferase [Betaproteobacteria bacterium]